LTLIAKAITITMKRTDITKVQVDEEYYMTAWTRKMLNKQKKKKKKK